MIECHDLEKSFGDKKVLCGLSCRIEDGRTVILMGPSGCGKTTFLSLLAGELTPDGGRINGMPERVSIAFQNDLLCLHLSVADNLKLVLGKGADDRIRGALEELGLSEEANSKARDLSGGMARRVSLARAMLYDAPLLLLDEPFRGLDGENRDRAAAFILAHKNERTLLCVTHDAEDAGRLEADEILHLSEGRIL